MAQPIWITSAGSLGNFPAGVYTEIQLQATPVSPATSLTYMTLGGSLPEGFQLNAAGKIYGTVLLITADTQFNFAIRATDNLGNIRDRTFSISISGSARPFFTTPSGSLLNTNDSTWVQLPIEYANPLNTNEVSIRLSEGTLPPGLEINEEGLIRGYAQPPIINVTVPSVVTSVTTTSTTNVITCLSTTNFSLGRQITFTGSIMLGGIEENVTYYIKSIINATSFTISTTQNGPELSLTSGSGFMTATLPATSVGQPTIRTYSFSLLLESQLGSDSRSYSITVINQNTPISRGGPGLPSNTRIPTIYNTRPPSYNLTTDSYYAYYVLPDGSTGYTYPPTTPAYIGTFQSGDFFSFKVIGKDFDNDELVYIFADMPLGLVGDSSNGWITGTPALSTQAIVQFGFSVAVRKVINPSISTPFFKYTYNLANDLSDTVTWITPNNLGELFNGSICVKNVKALAEVELNYRVVSGTLPPNLTLLDNGEITGYTSNQPSNTLLSQDTKTEFNFTVQAYSPNYPIIYSNKNFTLTVVQTYDQPTDTLYIKAAPDIEDRELINSLLNNETIIPTSSLYRPYDIYFGKATSVIYEHAYGIYASDLDEYLAAITQNHYWRYITLGEIKTATAVNDEGEVIYEVVYSQVIDNLVNPNGISLPQQIYWPRPINLNLGPWYTSITSIYTSYGQTFNQNYFTSLTPGSVRNLYPNSLLNMRNRVGQVLGQEYDSRLLPLWMTSKQPDGGTLGYTPAWVICYTKPGMSSVIKNNIETLWKHPEGTTYTLNEINFQIDRFSVNKSLTYNYDKNTVPPAWTGLPGATPVPNPIDSKDFYVLFPRKTILPN